MARLFAEILQQLKILSGGNFVETTGAKLANDGVNGLDKLLSAIYSCNGGVLFIDEAPQLLPNGGSNAGGLSVSIPSGGSAVLDRLLTEMENNIGRLVVVFAGYMKPMEALLAYNEGLPSRLPYRLHFDDYDESELLAIAVKEIEKKNKDVKSPLQFEDGERGLYMRIAVQRLAGMRGHTGFGNARSVQLMMDAIYARQAARVAEARRRNVLNVSVFDVLSVDIIGPPPQNALLQSSAWKELQGMIGLSRVKSTLENLAAQLHTNYELELREKPVRQVALNRIFLGSPGTGNQLLHA